MDTGFILIKENPRTNANFLSKLTYAWMLPLFKKGMRKGLEISDLYRHLRCDDSEILGNRLEKNWDKELIKAKEKQSNPSLIRAISKTFFWHYMFYGILLFMQFVGLRSTQPIILSYLLKLFSDKTLENNNITMYVSGIALVGTSIIIVFVTYHINFGQASIGMRIRVAVSSLIYRKLLRLSTRTLGQSMSGRVVNLLSNDTSRFDVVVIVLHYLWIMPFQFAVLTYFIWQEVGIATLAGVLAMIMLTLPVHAYLGRRTSTLRLQVAQKTDNRVRLMNEVISGIKVIKMYAWEKPFEKIIKIARSEEIKVVTVASYLRGLYLSCTTFPAKTAVFSTVVCYVLLGNDIAADKVFSIIQCFNLLQLALAIYYPIAISVGSETLVSIKRLQEFLVLEEKQTPVIQAIEEKRILLKNINASWTNENKTLENINLDIPEGTLCAVVGPVGSGKTSLLQLLLGELTPQAGSLKLGGDMSYSSQEPWLFSSTIRSNILFGMEYNRELYRKVVNVCALDKDFQQFSLKDKTLVGERGVSLSGGQKARINLARAIYRQADIYLMDDPLSAVDVQVAKYLFEECIVKYLKGKTRILVTHQLQYLKKADVIIVINEGKIDAKGTFSQLLKTNLKRYAKLLGGISETRKLDETKKEKTTYERRDSIISDLFDRRESVISNLSLKSKYEPDISEQTTEKVVPPNHSALLDYMKSSGSVLHLLIFAGILLTGQVALYGSDYWITYWTQLEEKRSIDNSTTLETQQIDTNIAIYIYTTLITSSIFITILCSFLFFKIAMNSSKSLHKKMFHSLLKSPMKFFDLNPSGRILNRFSKDMGAIDEILPRVLFDAIQVMLGMTGILVMVGISNQYNILVILVLGVIFMQIRKWYICTAKDIKHLEGTTKSPVFSHLNSSLDGIVTIRASKAEEILKEQFDSHQNVHTSAWFLTIACAVSFGLWLDIMCVVFFGCVTFGCIVLSQYNAITGSLAGLAITQALNLAGLLQHGMRQTAEVVNQLTSVERVLQYTTLDKEGPFETKKENVPPENWPSKGVIVFNNLSLKYSEDESPVLKKLNFTIESGEKIGIVGRTGAGKSSLISALFRFTPLEGNISIDGIDTKNIGLTDLRKNISIIPQEPVLFSATLRYNLDPFDEFEDGKLWHALEEVELKDSIHSLDFEVSEAGGNFSLGQRQLLCLARAIVRNNKILVLDEATANVDPSTDSLIQKTIRKKFQSCTVLTIAHRLNTIMDSDKVLVVDGGSIIEYDHPHNLLQNAQGMFSKMVAETGSSMSQHLKETASIAYKKYSN